MTVAPSCRKGSPPASRARILQQALAGKSLGAKDREVRMHSHAQVQVRPRGVASRLARLFTLTIAAVLVAGTVTGCGLLGRDAKVVFTTKDPSGYQGCNIKDTVTTIDAGTSVWMVIIFKSTMDKSDISVDVIKDGETFDSWSYDAADTEGADCFSDVDPFTDLEAGEYKFQAYKGEAVEAEGTLTVK
jgi:hypothetical protein